MIIFLAFLAVAVGQEVLLPPYFDIAKGKNITATATCGEDYVAPKGSPGELFCTLADATGKFGIKGLKCSHCVPGDYGDGDGKNARDHHIRNANDGSNRWWQSPPLSRGLQYRKINITMALGQSFHVAYVIIKAANSPRPGVWALERSNDNGRTYTPWYYFAPTSSECKQYFGVDSYLPIVKDDTVICSTEYSKIPPFKNGEIHISLINGRPGASNFSQSKTLQEWTTATNVRLRLLDIKTLLTDLLPLSLEDPTVTRRYYYSIKDITIGGRCMCNGFADECTPHTNIVGKYECNCQYNTEGPRCSRCKKGYVQKEWRQRTSTDKFECEKCNCHGHSDECEYNEEINKRKLSLDVNGNYQGGGVCKNCQHNTLGINCEKCKPFFYQPANVPIDSPNVCQPCNCDTQFSTGLCAEETGQCECKSNYVGRYCDQCNKGFHMFPVCKPCECDVNGSEDRECIPDQINGCKCKKGYAGRYCDECLPGYFGFPDCQPCACLTRYGAVNDNCERDNGQCSCKVGFKGRRCEECAAGHYQFPFCKECGCDPEKTLDTVCDSGTGVCQCKSNFAGPKCESCSPGFYAHPSCFACGCSTAGSTSSVCDQNSGLCSCRPNYSGFKCDRCAEGYYGFPNCILCDCNPEGSRRVGICDRQDGQCQCKPTYSGQKCDKCLPGFYGFPNCKRCNCNPAGTKPGPGGRPGDCSTSNNGQCVCKDNVQGLECNECKPGFFNLTESNRKGCSTCGCNGAGTNNGVKSCSVEGTCKCKPLVKQEDKCTECRDGYYGLKRTNVFGCLGCNCEVGGSSSSVCSKDNGQCPCKDNIVGKRCESVAANSFYPDLCHIKAEMEEGKTTDGDVVRYDYQKEIFPDFSWKGFVAVNDQQPSVVVSINVPKTSEYQVKFRYALNQIQPVTATVTAFKGDSKIVGSINFASTQKGSGFVASLATVQDNLVQEMYFPLTEGQWNIKLEAPHSNLVVDYAVLFPKEYAQGGALKKKVQNACDVMTDEKFCNLYRYIDVTDKKDIIVLEAENPVKMRQQKPPVLFNDTAVLSKLDFQAMVVLSPSNSRQLNHLFNVAKPGKYVVMLQYYHDSDTAKYLDVYVRSQIAVQNGRALLQSCRYTFGCRQAVLNRGDNGVFVFNIKSTKNHLLTLLSRYAVVAVDSVMLVPYESWHLDYSTPTLYCVTKDSKCTNMNYDVPAESRLVQANPLEQDLSEKPRYLIDRSVEVRYVKPGVNIINIRDVKAGNYLLVAHYYQPNFPSFESRAAVYSGRTSGLRARFDFKFCPNLNGCRSPIRRPDSNSNLYVFEEGEARIRFDIPNGLDAWIEYILMIPEGTNVSSLYTPRVLDYSDDFKKECSIDLNVCTSSNLSSFCKDSIFTITTDFNNGSFPCKCNMDGSKSSSCQEFGGKCPCKDNVIGRECSRCKVGYYGFPNCKPCNCSNCDEETGVCTCPRGVIGENCDQCAPGTFGFDPIIGCQKCNCNEIGTGSANAECNVTSGQCPCKENYSSRKCSACKPGYFNYPACTKCDCLDAGISAEKCDVLTGKCICQNNVIGLKCNECADGYFKTKDIKGKQLCAKCWCNGRSTKSCTEADLFRATPITASKGWTVSVDTLNVIENGNGRFTISDVNTLPEPVYWVAPNQFLGNRGLSYGSHFKYNFQYSVKQPSQNTNGDVVTDAVIKGDGYTIKSMRSVIEKENDGYSASILMKETEWTLEDGSTIDRELFLAILSDIDTVQILATHGENTISSTIYDISLETAGENGTDRVYGIEKCFCPKEYADLSCSKCSKGYTRQKDGSCGKCQCLGKSNICDPQNGKCINCSGNTMGDRCEKCKPGFYGDKCKACECPFSNPENSFANTCAINVNTSSLVCQCNAGYKGVRCDQCSDGYYGNPLQGVTCKKCSCNGNINASFTGNCDNTTGDCLKCLYNSDGNQCQECRDGYYGDAVVEKNCTDCQCSICGTTTAPCNKATGQCQCKKNVEGSKCNQCKPNTWNFDACNGCEDCNCAEASETQQCDLKTGQCKCPPTVFGRRCGFCKLGYYNYSSEGCQKCQCPDGKPCDVNTGKCCTGVLNEDCKLCPVGHIIEDGECVECDRCVQRTLQRVNTLIHNVTILEKHIIPAGGLNYGALETLGNRFSNLSNKGDEHISNLDTLKKAIGFGEYRNHSGNMDYVRMYLVRDFKSCSFKVNIKTPQPSSAPATTMVTNTPGPDPIRDHLSNKKISDSQCPPSLARVIDEGEKNIKLVEKKVVVLEKDAYESTENATGTKKRAEDLLAKLKDFMVDFKDVLSFANSTLKGNVVINIDGNRSLAEAEEMLKEIKDRNFNSTINRSEREKSAAINATIIAEQLMKQASELANKAYKFNDTFKDFVKALRNLKMESELALLDANNATNSINLAKAVDFQSIIDNAQKLHSQNNVTVTQAMEILQNAKSAYENAKDVFNKFHNQTGPLSDLMEELRNYVRKLEFDLQTTSPIVDDSVKHAKRLRDSADRLKELLQDTKKFADAALRAAKVYQNIVDAINDALDAARMANETAHEADKKVQQAQQDAVESSITSKVVDTEANDLTEEVKKTLKVDISDMKMRLKELRELRKRIQGRIDNVKEDVKSFAKEKEVGEKAMNISTQADGVMKVANKGNEASQDTNEKVEKDGEKVETLKVDISDINKAIKDLASNVTLVEDTIPKIRSNIDEVNVKHEQIEEFIKTNVTNNIGYLKYLISNAHDILDQMQLSMKFNSTSEVVLDAPKSVADPTINNKISLTFKINQGNGFLFIIGDFSGNSSGFMSLHVQNHTVVFDYKLNTGDVQSLTNPKFIETDVNYDVMVTRNFATAVLNVQKSGNASTLMTAYQNRSNISPVLSLGQDTNVYVGYHPSTPNQRPNFDGCINQFRFDEELMGLWHWKSAKNVGGCVQDFRSIEGQYSFDGDGFVEFDLVSPELSGFRKIELRFATLEENGLIFLGTDPPTSLPSDIMFDIPLSNQIIAFNALEIKDGYLVSTLDLGNGVQRLVHTNAGKVNDGKPHLFEMKVLISSLLIKFKLDKKKITEISISPDTDIRLRLKEAFIGGLPQRAWLPNSNISTKGFTGAIGDAKYRGGEFKLVKRFNNIRKGFILPKGYSASFPEEKSYLRLDACNLKQNSLFGFSFQTFEKNGIIFHSEEGSGSSRSSIEIILIDGQVKVDVSVGSQKRTLQTSVARGFSDGLWHTLSLYFEETLQEADIVLLYLAVDKAYITGTVPKVDLKGSMYFGSKPSGTESGFNGNIRQVYCNKNEINLASGDVFEGGVVGSLKLLPPLKLADFTVVPTTLPPLTTSITTSESTTTETVMTTSTTSISGTTLEPPKETTTNMAKTTENPTVKITSSEPIIETTMESTTVAKTTSPITMEESTTTPTSITTSTLETTISTLEPGSIEGSTTTAESITTTAAPITTTATEPITTTESITITQPITTVEVTTEPATTQESTTTPEPITTLETTTTLEPSTTPEPTTPEELTTTAKPTTTIKVTTEPPKCQSNLEVYDEAYGFGMNEPSFIEFGVDGRKMLKSNQFEFLFYTAENDGMMISSEPSNQYDYEYVYMENGAISYAFNAGAGRVRVTSTKKYNDGKWHEVKISRSKESGTLTIDGELIGTDSKSGKTAVNGIKKIVVGGSSVPYRNIPPKSQVGFKGGMRGFKLFNEALKPLKEIGITEAYDELPIPEGVSFGPDGGYVALNFKSEYVVRTEYKLALDVRSVSSSGYIFFIGNYGADYLSLYIESDRKVVAECNNGGGRFSVSIDVPTICNGEFHSILLEKKYKTLDLSVEGVQKSFTTTKGSTSADTGSNPPAFGGFNGVGSRPKNLETFTGCITAVRIKDKAVDLTAPDVTIFGQVSNGCPSNIR